MRCPFCQNPESRVIDSRASGDGIRRRRECEQCRQRFTTQERVELRLPMVVKKDGRRELYDREKLLHGMRLACRKRPIPAARLEEAMEDVDAEIVGSGKQEVSSREIGDRVLAALRHLDSVAFLRYASVYHELESAEAFLDLVRSVTERESP